MLFLDSSVLARAYLPDEPEHDALRTLIFESDQEVAASELVVVEVTRALAAATRARRLRARALADLLAQMEEDTGSDGAITLLDLDPRQTLARARELVGSFPLSTLDAIHLAVAERDGRRVAVDDDLVFVTRDDDQRRAAEALGFETA